MNNTITQDVEAILKRLGGSQQDFGTLDEDELEELNLIEATFRNNKEILQKISSIRNAHQSAQ